MATSTIRLRNIGGYKRDGQHCRLTFLPSPISEHLEVAHVVAALLVKRKMLETGTVIKDAKPGVKCLLRTIYF
jgi:hypothetical protein